MNNESMTELDNFLDEAPSRPIVNAIKLEYANLRDHINLLRELINQESRTDAEVYVLPVPTQSDVGKEWMDYSITETLVGQLAVEKTLIHYGQNILRHEQAGVMSHRLPGVIWVNQVDEPDILSRIRKINHIKDDIKRLINEYSDSAFAQFTAMKSAAPYAVRKSISRHIHAFPADSVTNVGYSISNRVATSKSLPRDKWIAKLESAKLNITQTGELNIKDWEDMYDREISILSSLANTTYLRIHRPLRKAPIVNIKMSDGKKTTQIAHSPIVLINHSKASVRYRPFKAIAQQVQSVVKKTPVIPRMHLYLAEKPRDNEAQAYVAVQNTKD